MSQSFWYSGFSFLLASLLILGAWKRFGYSTLTFLLLLLLLPLLCSNVVKALKEYRAPLNLRQSILLNPTITRIKIATKYKHLKRNESEPSNSSAKENVLDVKQTELRQQTENVRPYKIRNNPQTSVRSSNVHSQGVMPKEYTRIWHGRLPEASIVNSS